MSNVSHSKIYPVILSGGTGTRLWPLSRELHPKQLQTLHSQLSLLQETASRFSDKNFENPLIICNQEHRFIVAEHLHEINIKPEAIILEPVGRNTAPAAAIASIILAKRDPDTMILVVPSDHIIKDEQAFKTAIKLASPLAENGSLVTFGIRPTSPATGYGYIEKSIALPNYRSCFKVEHFYEKPSFVEAKSFLSSSDYLWNSGIFLFTAKTFLSELGNLSPKITKSCISAVSKAIIDLDFYRLDEKAFTDCPAISIDYAVMEKTSNIAVIETEMGWSDIGSWDALWQVLDKDKNGNIMSGDVILHNTKNSFVRSESKLVTVLGMEDTIVVATDDAILVSKKESAQDVKILVDKLKTANRTEHISHTKVYRPWGWYKILEIKDRYQVKIINILPNSKISLQRHQHRSEHWIVVSGIATVTRGEDVIELKENQSTYIPIGMIHRLENLTGGKLQIIEVQSGNYLGEDDIERFDDEYGRHK
jgi:mannose-1-phosphate guanylyltransferase/mannose-6-phosphate isomerase